MKPLSYVALGILISITGVSQAQSPVAGAAPGFAIHESDAQKSDREKFVGAWHLARIDAPASDANTRAVAQPIGMLLYTRDGDMSVQLMYPDSPSLSNAYVLNGYEASFGSYDVDEARHQVTHHVQGSITRGLVGKDLPRAYQFTEDGRLIIKSADPGEHWQVIWEHD